MASAMVQIKLWKKSIPPFSLGKRGREKDKGYLSIINGYQSEKYIIPVFCVLLPSVLLFFAHFMEFWSTSSRSKIDSNVLEVKIKYTQKNGLAQGVLAIFCNILIYVLTDILRKVVTSYHPSRRQANTFLLYGKVGPFCNNGRHLVC